MLPFCEKDRDCWLLRVVQPRGKSRMRLEKLKQCAVTVCAGLGAVAAADGSGWTRFGSGHALVPLLFTAMAGLDPSRYLDALVVPQALEAFVYSAPKGGCFRGGVAVLVSHQTGFVAWGVLGVDAVGFGAEAVRAWLCTADVPLVLPSTVCVLLASETPASPFAARSDARGVKRLLDAAWSLRPEMPCVMCCNGCVPGLLAVSVCVNTAVAYHSLGARPKNRSIPPAFIMAMVNLPAEGADGGPEGPLCRCPRVHGCTDAQVDVYRSLHAAFATNPVLQAHAAAALNHGVACADLVGGGKCPCAMCADLHAAMTEDPLLPPVARDSPDPLPIDTGDLSDMADDEFEIC
jgi:hypothetical protein